MDKIKVDVLNHSAIYNEDLLVNITALTYSKKMNNGKGPNLVFKLLNTVADMKILRNVINMKHTSILEHLTFTFVIEGASRSLLAQITRHRLFSFTSGSQHYIDYRNIADFVIPMEILDDKANRKMFVKGNKKALERYSQMIENGLPHEVARGVLPNSMRNNLVMTGNLRQFMNFINQRLCNRNTSEVQYIAYLIYKKLCQFVPETMKMSGADCMTTGKCSQGSKFCGQYIDINYLDEKFRRLLDENTIY